MTQPGQLERERSTRVSTSHMDADFKKKLTKIVNASGFVFQLAIEQHIKKTVGEHQWHVVTREHPWRNTETGNTGFIDLILERNFDRLVIECKRTHNARWIFLLEKKEKESVGTILCQWSETIRPRRDIERNFACGCWDFVTHLSSAEAEFCTIRGSGEKDQPMLERIAKKLVQSVDSLIIEQKNNVQRKEYERCIYLPVIVTTAELYTCLIDPEKVSLESGEISYEDTHLQKVPYVQFKKTLATDLNTNIVAKNLRDINNALQRTVLVVSARKLRNFLQILDIIDTGHNPWYFAPLLKQTQES